MPDKTYRKSTAAASVNGIADKMNSECGNTPEVNTLRSLVDMAAMEVVKGLDSSISENFQHYQLLKPYVTYQDLFRHGDHLEHMHAYYGVDSDVDGGNRLSGSAPTMDYHTDYGLMIAMTAGLYQSEPSPDSGLYIKLPTDIKTKVKLDDNSLIILAGEGMSRWLIPKLGLPIRPVPHAMFAGLNDATASRSWYGKMYLPPGDAYLNSEHMTYSEYRKLQAMSSAKQDGTELIQSSRNYLPLACGHHHSPVNGSSNSNNNKDGIGNGDSSVSYDNYLVTNTLCTDSNGKTGVMCWQRCMSVSDLSCGTSAECYDPIADEIVPGTSMCPESDMSVCYLKCFDTNSNYKSMNMDTDSNDYCSGNGVSMFMDGFHAIGTERKGSTACVNILFKEWTLDNETKFAFGCLGVLLLGIFIQFLTKLRFDVNKKNKKSPSVNGNVVELSLYSTQVVLSYFAMLIAMTYSVELFVMVCVGLIIGFAIFNLSLPPSESTEACCSANEIPDDIKVSLL